MATSETSATGAAATATPTNAEQVTSEDKNTSIFSYFPDFSLTPPIQRGILRTGITDDTDLATLIGNSIAAIVYAVCFVSFLGTMGIDTSPLITGLGVTGFTVGFALKEIATNFLSGVFLVLQKPFHKGQHLRVMVTPHVLEGTVESIDARYVRLLTVDSNRLIIPSSIVYSNAMVVGPGKLKSK